MSKRLLAAAAMLAGIIGGQAAHSDSKPPAPALPHCVAGMAMTAPEGNPSNAGQWAKGAQLLPGLGNYQYAVSTHSAEARQYFDQGLRLIYGFNHDEAARSFARAVQLDPHCALCWWGLGEALGPNYNVPAMPERWQVLWSAVQSAQHEAAGATPVEQALIGALAKRYAGPQPVDPGAMKPFNDAYANAMRAVAVRFPADDDVQVFFAEALMTANPWKLWSIDGTASPGTEEIVTTLQKVLARNPAHPGANHYYIHAVEASPHPELALASAARLPQLMPGAGHIVHMPAHIYQRVGRYADASAANEAAIKADLAYSALAKPPAYSYYGMYLAHNYQFLAYSASMEGRLDTSHKAAIAMAGVLPREVVLSMPGSDWALGERYFVEQRFGRWDELLVDPAPDANFKAQQTAYHFAQAIAYAAKGQVPEAKAAQAKFEALAKATPVDMSAGLNKAQDVFAVASKIAAARIARAERRPDESIAALREAVKLEDKLAYDEPADWFFPVRHLLGSELLAAGKAADAEAVYREDLRRMPDNGWSLRGLQQALVAQKKQVEADAVGKQLQAAWKAGDAGVTASAF